MQAHPKYFCVGRHQTQAELPGTYRKDQLKGGKISASIGHQIDGTTNPGCKMSCFAK